MSTGKTPTTASMLQRLGKAAAALGLLALVAGCVVAPAYPEPHYAYSYSYYDRDHDHGHHYGWGRDDDHDAHYGYYR